ncbi:PLP-dependent cysteine synthase family protein [Halobacterium sp. CBA1126]|uniref:PLP-dependent cysteine synthase family protein n=1 Tax=Halobacterium sp. CBA1126 TaxID=2668074 RepID=UPI0012FC0E44|nr:cysteine synthase family protein [Halobacterium sp. CBA1126]MUV59615.1 pyridoxal-phosphate dependent enzyme [Halobacterium sp. CBA1126]
MADVDRSEVGRTPLVELDAGVAPTVYGKAEWFNLAPLDHGGGSVKTRIGQAMLQAAAARGDLDGDRTILEASSGNTGSAVARVGAAMGHDVEIVLPDDAGGGKVDAIRDAGAELRFVDAEAGYDAFVMRCRDLAAERPEEYVYPNQYQNPANPAVHAGTTGPEIWRQTGGEVTHFVAGAGTGGTLVGVSHALRPRGVRVHGYEPPATDHDIAGLKHMHDPGTFVPDTYEFDALDGREYVDTDTAYDYVRRLRCRHADAAPEIRDAGQWSRGFVRSELRVNGEFLVGPSSGGAVAMVDRLAERGTLDADDVVVVPLPDRGDRYPDREPYAEHVE